MARYGLVWVQGKNFPKAKAGWYRFSNGNEITAGKNKGKIMVILLNGKKAKVEKDCIRKWPEA